MLTRMVSLSSTLEMPSLPDLPTETLRQISVECCPEGIEELALCSKGLYEAVMDQLQQHRDDKRRCELVWPMYNLSEQYGRYGKKTSYSPGPSEVLFTTIMRQPRLAAYVTSLTIHHDELRLSGNRVVMPKSGLMKEFLDVDECGLIELDEKLQWQQMLQPDNSLTPTEATVIACMLIWRLPNLETITTHYEGDVSTENILIPFIDKIEVANRLRLKDGAKPAAPGKLREATIFGYGTDAELFRAFAMLPSMRTLELQGASWNSTLDWPTEKGKSSVTELRFDRSSTVWKLSGTLQHIEILEKFTYQQKMLRHQADAMSRLIEELGDFASQTLKEIRLGRNKLHHFREPEHFLGDGCLKRFAKLEHITADLTMFARGTGDADDRLPRLVDLIPTSTVILTLLDDGHFNDHVMLRDLFKDIEELKADRLPHFKQITIRRERGLIVTTNRYFRVDNPRWMIVDNEAMTMCEKVGIALVVEECTCEGCKTGKANVKACRM